MKAILVFLIGSTALVSAQSSQNFALEAASSNPTAQTAESARFRLDASLGNVFAGYSTSPCREIAAGIMPHRLPADLGGPLFDSDRDRLSDGWELFYFLTLSAGGSDDSDGDGESNLNEQLAATNPLLAASVFRMIAVADTGTTVSFSWTGGHSKLYEIQYSPDLGFAVPWTTIGSTSTNAAGVGSFSDNEPSRTNLPAGFYRAVLVR